MIPTVTVRDVNGNVVDPSKYDVAYKDNTASGKGLVVVSSKDNAYGSVVALFTINDVRTRVDIPTAKSFTYNTKARVGVASAEGYTLTGTTSPTAGRKAGRTRVR